MISKQTLHTLEERRQFLEKIIHDAEKKIIQAPPGSVEIKKHGKGVQFYYRDDSRKKHGTYIPVSERKRAVSLTQKRYFSRLLSAANKQKKAIDTFLRNYDPNALIEIYNSEGVIRQSLINPVELPDAEYVHRWLSAEYQSKEIREDTPVHFTNKQERVRSKSEVIIANALFRCGIPYKYECPLQLSNTTVYPDFTVLRIWDRKILYWEHLGLIDDTEYRNQALQKIHLYEENGIFPGDHLILTMETFKIPLNSMTVQGLIKHYLL